MNTINIAGIDELGLLKKRLVNKFSKDKNGKTCHFRSCNANIEFLLNDNDVQYNINVSNPPVKTFVSYFCGADVLFFDVNPNNASVIIDYNFGDIVLPDAKLVVFRFSSKEEFAKIASQDLVKCFPNAVIAGFKFKVNGIKGFTNFLHSQNFYKLLNGDSSKDNSDESNKKRITKLLNSDEFKSLCKKNISSDFFYSSAIDEDLYLKANSSEIENYNSLSKAIQCEINKDNDPDKLAKIKNSAVFVGTVMFDAFESLVNDEDLQYNVAIIKNAHHDIYEQFKKKDFDLIFPGYSMPIKTLSGVRPGDIMLSVDSDIMSENFHIVSSVSNDGKVDIVGLNKGKIISKSLNVKEISNGTGSNGFVSDVNYSLNCSVKNKNSVCNVKNGSTYTLVSVAGENISMENVKPLGVEAVKDSSGMSFYFVRPLLLNHLFDELEGDIIPASIVVNKSVSPKQEKDLNKFFSECEKTLNNYKIIRYIKETALNNYSEDMNNLGLFEYAGYFYSFSDRWYWEEMNKRIHNYNIKSIFTQEEKDAMYQMHKADSSFSVMNEAHKKIFGVDYDKDKVEAANKAFYLYLTMYRLSLFRENIDNQVKSILSDAIYSKAYTDFYNNSKVEKFDQESNLKQTKQYNAIDKEKHDNLFNLFCNIFGVVNKSDYSSLSTDELIKVITEYTKTFDFIADLLPNIENYASYHSIEAFGYDFAIIIKCEKKLLEKARHRGEVLKDVLVFLMGCMTGPLASKIAGKAASSGRLLLTQAGLDAGTSVLLDTMDLLYKSGVSYNIDYKSEIAKIFVNAILGFGLSIVVGASMEKCTKYVTEIITKRNATKLGLESLKKKGKDGLELVIKNLENENNVIVSYLEMAEREFNESIKKFISLEKEFQFNQKMTEKLDYIFSNQFLYKNNKEIKFLIGDNRSYNVDDLFKDKDILKDLESEIKKYLNGTELKNYSILGPKEKMAFIIERKKVQLKNYMSACEQTIKGAEQSRIELIKLLEEFNSNRAGKVEAKMREILEDPKFKIEIPMDVAALKKVIDNKYKQVTPDIEMIISEIEAANKAANKAANNEKTILLLEKYNEARNNINQTLEEYNFLLGAFGSLFSTYLGCALSSKTSSLFDNSDEKWLDRPVEDVISENINMIQMSSINEEYREKLKKECAGYKITNDQQGNMVSIIADNPFTILERNIIFKDEIKIAKYSTDVMNLAKEILTEQNVSYDQDYTEYKHLKIVSYAQLINNLISNNKWNVKLDKIEQKDKQMRQKYPKLNEVLKETY